MASATASAVVADSLAPAFLTAAYTSLMVREPLIVFRKALAQSLEAMMNNDTALMLAPIHMSAGEFNESYKYSVSQGCLMRAKATRAKAAGVEWNMPQRQLQQGGDYNTQIVASSTMKINTRLARQAGGLPSVSVSMLINGSTVTVDVQRLTAGAGEATGVELTLGGKGRGRGVKVAAANEPLLLTAAAFLMGEVRLALKPRSSTDASVMVMKVADSLGGGAFPALIDAAGQGLALDVEEMVGLTWKNRTTRAYND